jgi:predicted nucleotidyltransferase
MSPLEKAVLATLVYYDVLDRPLTSWEVFKYLNNTGLRKSKVQSFEYDLALQDRSSQCQTLDSVLETLENSSELKKIIDQKNGFYFLKGRQEIVKERIERQKIADQKWKKAKRVIKLLQLIPFIRLVAVSGSLAMNNTKKESDIDLLIVAKSGRIWTCRGLTTLFIHLIGQRRHGSLTKDRFCLNHYLTDLKNSL